MSAVAFDCTWEELQQKAQDLAGHRLLVVTVDELPKAPAPADTVPAESEQIVLEALRRACRRSAQEPALTPTQRLVQGWLAEDATDDPAAIAEAEEDLRRFKAGMNRNRIDAGEEPVYR